MEISYTQIGDYLLPNIAVAELPAEEKIIPLGRYARMHRVYLKEHCPILYNKLLLSEKLFPILRQIDETANRRLSLADKSDKYSKDVIIQGVINDLVYS